MAHARFIAEYCISAALNSRLKRLRRACYKITGEASVVYSMTKEPVPYAERESLDYKPIKKGAVWSNDSYEAAWFRLKGVAPVAGENEQAGIHFSIKGEGLIYDANGIPLLAVAKETAFVELAQPLPKKSFVPLQSGEEFDIWVDAGNNVTPNRKRKEAVLQHCEIVLVRNDIKALYYDITTLLYQRQAIADRAKKASISAAVSAAFKAAGSYSPDEIAAARAIIAKEYLNGESDLRTVYATGHAHLDLAWLWPIRETKRKAVRTFANQLRNIQKYDGYVFGASQPQQFEWMENLQPEIFKEIEKAVLDGKIEIQGGMWVESDTNIGSGESLVRQCLYGQKYWKEKFGKQARIGWLPDCFGFSGNLPQIYKKSGMDRFLTQKMSWNSFNKFPHKNFIWEGIDGSSVLTHMPPDDTYNSGANAWAIQRAASNFPEKDKVPVTTMLFGVGDGGGGPGEGHLEAAIREKDIKGMPKTVLAPASEFFDELEKYRGKLLTHKGEMYLEKHVGTYTSQSKNKYWNRKSEIALHDAEFLGVVAADKGYTFPKADIDKLWKEVLLYQFHDIIPGSSVERVYKESRERYAVINTRIKQIADSAQNALAEGAAASVINATSFPYKGLVPSGDKWYEVDAAPYSAVPVTEFKGETKLEAGDDFIGNENLIVKFASDGSISGLFVKEAKKEFAGGFINRLNVYKDLPKEYDAWDLNIRYTKTVGIGFKKTEAKSYIEGCAAIRETSYKYGKSKITQKVVLVSGENFVRFVTDVEWNECHKMLRAEFIPSVYSDTVECGIQFGSLKRSTQNQTSVEKAQFEIAAQKWIDLSDEEKGAGISFMAEAKYGWRVKEGLVSLNLLRSPTFPDPNADRGFHTIRYAVYPHLGNIEEAGAKVLAEQYNHGFTVIPEAVTFPSFASTSDPRAVIDTIKPAENGEGYIIRLYNDSYADITASLTLARPGTAVETDLLENEIGAIDPANLTFTPFEIKTIKII